MGHEFAIDNISFSTGRIRQMGEVIINVEQCYATAIDQEVVLCSSSKNELVYDTYDLNLLEKALPTNMNH